jgi:hypothetical protein
MSTNREPRSRGWRTRSCSRERSLDTSTAVQYARSPAIRVIHRHLGAVAAVVFVSADLQQIKVAEALVIKTRYVGA